MTWIIGVFAVVLVLLGFTVFGGVGGMTAVLLVAVLAGAVIALNRTRRSHP